MTASPTTTFEARGREVWALNAWNDEADTVGPLDFCYCTVSEQAYDPERYAKDIANLLGGGDALRAEIDRLQSQLEAGPPAPPGQVERIATAAMKGMLSNGAGSAHGVEGVNQRALEHAMDMRTRLEALL